MNEIINVLSDNNLRIGRMISPSKSMYRETYPNNLVIFNANLIHPQFGKIWYGDIDITKDGELLKQIANQFNTTFYFLYESDCRFETEDLPIEQLIKKSVWSTEL
jgi:hypothetical protein